MKKKLQQESNLTLKDLDILYQSWHKVNDDIIFPIYIDIKDIEFEYENIQEEKVEFLRQDIRINKTDNPFKELYNEYNFKKEFLYYLKFIDNRKIFNNCTQSFIEYIYDCNTTEDFYYKLIELGYNYSLFHKLKLELSHYINKIKNDFIEKCKLLFEYDKEFPNISIKKDAEDSRYEEFYTYPLNMTYSQSAMEYSNVIVFPENKDKCYSEYSWREIQFKTMYIHTKNKIEGFMNKVQLYKMQKDRKE